MGAERTVRGRDGDGRFKPRLEILPHENLVFLPADENGEVTAARLHRADELCRSLERWGHHGCHHRIGGASLILVNLASFRRGFLQSVCGRLGLLVVRLGIRRLVAGIAAIGVCAIGLCRVVLGRAAAIRAILRCGGNAVL
jgi:hypothetical protein